ncbi:MAG: zinc ribbon domain-containing protein [Defluviitaleaceae bacterium]|nr:zinc ribbon domain-containing protein [Defluviitaleaceae bacterium]
MSCKNCTFTFEAEMAYCPKCGTKTAESIETESAEEIVTIPAKVSLSQSGNTRKKIIVAVSAVAALLLLTTTMVLLLTMNYNPPYEVINIGRYDEIHYISGGRFYVSRGDRWGVLDIRGNEIVPFGRFDLLLDITYDGDFIVNSGRTFYVISRNSTIYFDRYDSVQFATPQGNRFIVTSGTRHGVIDTRGNEIIPLGTYSNIIAAHDGRFFIVTEGNRMGILNTRGSEVVSLGRYDDIRQAPNDRFIATTGEWGNMRWAVIDSRGNEIIPLGRFEEIVSAGTNTFIARDGENWGVLDHRASTTIPFIYDNITAAGENFIARDGDRLTALDSGGNEIIPLGRHDGISYMGNNNFLIRDGDWSDPSWGVISARGDEIIASGRFEEIRHGHGDTFIVRTGGNASWRAIDSRGNEIIPSGLYDEIERFPLRSADYGGFLVTRDNRVAFLNLNGQEIIPMGRYDAIFNIHDNLAIVGRGTARDIQLGVINTRRNP